MLSYCQGISFFWMLDYLLLLSSFIFSCNLSVLHLFLLQLWGIPHPSGETNYHGCTCTRQACATIRPGMEPRIVGSFLKSTTTVPPHAGPHIASCYLRELRYFFHCFEMIILLLGTGEIGLVHEYLGSLNVYLTLGLPCLQAIGSTKILVLQKLTDT